ncbi:MAG: tetratricopeptide repeat protein [Actinomycetota bacterium]
MAAAASLHELPPLTTLQVAPADDGALCAAESLVAAYRYAEACDALEELWPEVRHDAALALRQRLALAWSKMYVGELEEAAQLLSHAEAIAGQARFDAADRAEVFFRQGCVALQQGRYSDAGAMLTRALETNERAPRRRDGLAARAHEWRSRCFLVQHDADAARRDVELALELATRAGDAEAQAHALFQASIVAERQEQWLLARCYAEQALDLYGRLQNHLAEARVLNNLGGIAFLLGETESAEATLLAAIERADHAGSEADFAQAVNSLAQVYLRSGRPVEARARAQRAIELLAGRDDFLDELGNAQLVVATALQAEGDPLNAASWLAIAEQTFLRFGSTGHVARAWVAQGDLSRTQGDVDRAADLYRQAAVALQDVHF